MVEIGHHQPSLVKKEVDRRRSVLKSQTKHGLYGISQKPNGKWYARRDFGHKLCFGKIGNSKENAVRESEYPTLNWHFCILLQSKKEKS